MCGACATASTAMTRPTPSRSIPARRTAGSTTPCRAAIAARRRKPPGRASSRSLRRSSIPPTTALVACRCTSASTPPITISPKTCGWRERRTGVVSLLQCGLALHGASEQLQVRLGGCNEPSVKRDIVLGHSTRREPIFESAPNLLAGQAPDSVHGRCRTRLVFDDETGHSVLDDLGDGTAIEGYDGRAA